MLLQLFLVISARWFVVWLIASQFSSSAVIMGHDKMWYFLYLPHFYYLAQQPDWRTKTHTSYPLNDLIFFIVMGSIVVAVLSMKHNKAHKNFYHFAVETGVYFIPAAVITKGVLSRSCGKISSEQSSHLIRDKMKNCFASAEEEKVKDQSICYQLMPS